jgi:hypothetical protein
VFPGPKPLINVEEFQMIRKTFCSFLAIGQENGKAEKKTSNLIAHVEHLLKGKKIYDALTLFLKIKNLMH